MTDLVLVDQFDGIALVTLNRPDALNALSSELRSEIVRVFRALQADDSVEVAILTGSGRAFTAGLDLKELGGEIGDTAMNAADLDVQGAILDFDRPLIGAVNGFAITGGFEIALMCDFLIASTEARFADTHARVGVVPGWGLSQKLPRLIGVNRARELSLTGNYLFAEQAMEWGLVNRVVAPEELLPVCEQIARDILSTDRATRQEILRITEAGWHTTLAEGLALEASATRAHRVSTAAVAERRSGIQERGRNQSGS